MSPKLAAAFTTHLQRLRDAGHTTGLSDHIQNARGERVTRQRLAAIIREAAQAATDARAREGLPPLPRTTLHSLRRTYISIALRANNYDVKFIMATPLEHRANRDHGARFDEVIGRADEEMHGSEPEDVTQDEQSEANPADEGEEP